MTAANAVLARFPLADQHFRLRRAVESDVGPIVDLMARDQLRAAVDSAAPERRAPCLAAFHAIDADPAHLLCVVDDDAGQWWQPCS
ncbi:hypothetical protein [Arthrobacter dokdonensis]|uniref:hypothetical protein n=1 Tax=Arthrobacter dokdonellae TaxID=2211210 RepID=UPI000DE58EA9